MLFIKLDYTVYGKESGEVKSFKTLREAKEFIKYLRKFDKENNIEDIYYIEKDEY